MIHRLGLGQMMVTDDVDATLRIIGLGSCIGMAVMAPHRRLVGLAHVVLPESDINPQIVGGILVCLLMEDLRSTRYDYAMKKRDNFLLPG